MVVKVRGTVDKCSDIALRLKEILEDEGLNHGERLAVLGIFSAMIYTETAYRFSQEVKQ